jgi:hypothetical protein
MFAEFKNLKTHLKTHPKIKKNFQLHGGTAAPQHPEKTSGPRQN